MHNFPLLKVAAFGYRAPKPNLSQNIARRTNSLANSIDRPIADRNKPISLYQNTTNATANHTISADFPMLKNASGMNNGTSLLAAGEKSMSNVLAQTAPKIDNSFLSGNTMLNKSMTDSSLYNDSLQSGMNATQGFLSTTGQRHKLGLGAQLMGQ